MTLEFHKVIAALLQLFGPIALIAISIVVVKGYEFPAWIAKWAKGQSPLIGLVTSITVSKSSIFY